MISCVYTLIFIPVGGDAQTNVAERLNLFDTTRGFPMQSLLTLEQILEVTFLWTDNVRRDSAEMGRN